MNSVVIGFSQPNKRKIGAEVIKWYMGTPYSHVYLRVFSNYTGQNLVYQASHGSVHLRTYERFLGENRPVKEFSLDVDNDRLKQTITLAQKLLGAPYGYLGLIKLVFRRKIHGFIGDDSKSFHCSEFIATLFPEIAYKCEDLDFIEPKHLYAALEERFGA